MKDNNTNITIVAANAVAAVVKTTEDGYVIF